MSSPDEMVQCPSCNEVFPHRDLICKRKIQVIQYCRKCGGVVESDDAWENTDELADLQKTVEVIDSWLASVAGVQIQRNHDLESEGVYLWSIKGLPVPWRCEVFCNRSLLDVVQVRLCVDVAGANDFPADDVLMAECVSRCLQPVGKKPAPEMGTTGRGWWGAMQLLGTGTTGRLLPKLFRAVVDRLDEAIRAVAPK